MSEFTRFTDGDRAALSARTAPTGPSGDRLLTFALLADRLSSFGSCDSTVPLDGPDFSGSEELVLGAAAALDF